MATISSENCEVCNKVSGKYRCPRCKTVTCSLDCSKNHKKLKNYCDGVRDKSSFIPKDQLTTLDLMSDYSLIQSANKCIEAMARDKIIQLPTSTPDQNKNRLSKRCYNLKTACQKRNNCAVSFLPSHFKRHRDNTSRFFPKDGEIKWRIEWIFPHLNKKSSMQDGVSETSRLRDLVQQMLDSEVVKVGEENESVDGIYTGVPLRELTVLLKTEGFSDSSRRFTELDPSKSLVWNLQERSVLEHPVIYIVRSDHIDFFLDDKGNEEILEPTENESSSTANIEEETLQSDQSAVENSLEYQKYYDYYLNYYQDKYLTPTATTPQQPTTSEPSQSSALVHYSDSE